MPDRGLTKKKSRRATAGQAAAMEGILSGLMPDTDGTSALKAGCEDSGSPLAGELPDEELEAARKVDFSVLKQALPAVLIYPDEVVERMDAARAAAYAISLGKALKAFRKAYLAAAEQLSNAQELFLNGRNALFGRSSRRFSAIMGKQAAACGGAGEGGEGKGKESQGDTGKEKRRRPGAAAKDEGKEEAAEGICGAGPAAGSGQDSPSGKEAPEKGDPGKGKEGGTTLSKGRPRRQKGCADRACRDAQENVIHVYKDAQELDRIFGKGNWEELEKAGKVVKSYRVIPAKVVVDKYILHQYRAKDPDICNGAAELCTARMPIDRLRPKSRASSSLIAHLLYFRSSLRIPPARVCCHMASLGLDLTPQQFYENLGYYGRFFDILQERQWVKLLDCHYLQIDETPLRYYDRKEKKVKRGYMWVFTASEMLDDAEKITLFYFAQGRGADVLRECLSGFTGVIGSDGHRAYQVFARESGGTVANAGCLEHFRKRVVAALRAVPGLDRMTEEEKDRIPAYVILKRLNRVFELERKVKLLKTKAEREAFREDQVREAFEAVVSETFGLKDSGLPSGSYLASAIRYMENQEVYLEEFLKDGNIACQNSKSEQKIAFFAVLRGQIKMFGSFRGGQVAGTLEGVEQTARKYVKYTRVYYQFLLDEMVPYIRKIEKAHPGKDVDWAHDEGLDRFMPWSEDYLSYEKNLKKQEQETPHD